MNDEKTMKFNKKAEIVCVIMACFFAVTFVTGTFLDYRIAPVLFRDSDMIALTASTFGIYVFCAAYAFYFGALMSQAVSVPATKKGRIKWGIITGIVAFAALLICGGSVLDVNNLGGIFHGVDRTVPQMIIMLIVGLMPIFFIGYRSCMKRKDAKLAKHLLLVLVAMTAVFLMYELVKVGLPRPRYRLLARNFEGIEFRRWYAPVKNKAELIAKYKINKDDFKSFPSGHTANNVANAFIFPALALTYPKLKDKRVLLFIIGMIIAVSTLLSRMILGAHFLSDVSCGGFIASVISALYYRFYRKIS